MTDVVVASELWSTNLFPEGILERWRVTGGTIVREGQVIAEVRIGDSLHELTAPAAGQLTIEAHKNDVVEPGSVIGRVF